MQQLHCTGNLDNDQNITIFFILEEVKETM